MSFYDVDCCVGGQNQSSMSSDLMDLGTSGPGWELALVATPSNNNTTPPQQSTSVCCLKFFFEVFLICNLLLPPTLVQIHILVVQLWFRCRNMIHCLATII